MRIDCTTRRPAPDRRRVFFMCAGHERPLGGESPLPILTEEKG